MTAIMERSEIYSENYYAFTFNKMSVRCHEYQNFRVFFITKIAQKECIVAHCIFNIQLGGGVYELVNTEAMENIDLTQFTMSVINYANRNIQSSNIHTPRSYKLWDTLASHKKLMIFDCATGMLHRPEWFNHDLLFLTDRYSWALNKNEYYPSRLVVNKDGSYQNGAMTRPVTFYQHECNDTYEEITNYPFLRSN